MYNGPHPTAAQYPQIPPRVQAAQQFLHFAHSLRAPMPVSPFEPPSGDLRDLSPKELAAYNAALVVLTSYFLGEMDYGDSAPMLTERRPDDDQPQIPEPVA